MTRALRAVSAAPSERPVIKKRQRLVRDSRFREVYQYGQSWVHPLLVLRALRNDLPISRFGFVVGKRIGKAVKRNRVKRVMREALRLRLANVPSGLDVVLTARVPIVGTSFNRVGEALDSLLPHLSEALGSGADSPSAYTGSRT